MITLLSKIFIPDTMSESEKRSAYGILCSVVGIVLNLILSAGKIIMGTIAGSITVSADGFNNLSDAGSSIITMVGFKLAGKRPDRAHPYGYGKVEHIAGFIVALLILLVAFDLLKESAIKIFHPESTVFSVLTVAVLAASILVKSYMAYYNFSVGKKINSDTIKAVGTDSLSDCIGTSVAFVAVLVEHFLGVNIDGYSGVVVGLFVLLAGYNAAKDTIAPLLGLPPEKEYVDELKELVLNYDSRVLGMHDLFVHDYGPGRRFISLHCEVPRSEDVMALHEMIDALEKAICEQLECMATIHMDPIENDNETVRALSAAVRETVKSLNASYTMHDFRIVTGEKNTNLIFDVAVPVDERLGEGELIDLITAAVREKLGGGYSCVIEIDRDIYTEK